MMRPRYYVPDTALCLRRLMRLLPRSAVLLAIAIGALSGHERAAAQAAKDSERLAAAYVQTYDARTMQMMR